MNAQSKEATSTTRVLSFQRVGNTRLADVFADMSCLQWEPMRQGHVRRSPSRTQGHTQESLRMFPWKDYLGRYGHGVGKVELGTRRAKGHSESAVHGPRGREACSRRAEPHDIQPGLPPLTLQSPLVSPLAPSQKSGNPTGTALQASLGESRVGLGAGGQPRSVGQIRKGPEAPFPHVSPHCDFAAAPIQR